MAGKTAALFQGQDVLGKQERLTLEMIQTSPIIQSTFDEVSDTLGFDVAERYLSSTKEDLRLTYNAQLCAFMEGVACWRWMLEHQEISADEIDYFLGHSAGQIPSLVGNKVLTVADGARVIHARGRIMNEVASNQDGIMTVLSNRRGTLDITGIRSICKEYDDAVIGGYNTVQQIMITGGRRSVEQITDRSVEEGYAERKRPVATQGAWHSPLMKEVPPAFREAISSISFEDAKIPLVANSTAKSIWLGEEAREELIVASGSPLLWLQSNRLLTRQGVRTFLEVNPSELLTKMAPRGSRRRKLFAIALGVGGAAGTLYLGSRAWTQWQESKRNKEQGRDL